MRQVLLDNRQIIGLEGARGDGLRGRIWHPEAGGVMYNIRASVWVNAARVKEADNG